MIVNVTFSADPTSLYAIPAVACLRGVEQDFAKVLHSHLPQVSRGSCELLLELAPSEDLTRYCGSDWDVDDYISLLFDNCFPGWDVADMATEVVAY